jgi:hypothetical protein
VRCCWMRPFYALTIIIIAGLFMLATMYDSMSFQSRAAYAVNNAWISAQRPIIGHGIGTGGLVYYAYQEPVVKTDHAARGQWPRRLHNDWLQAAVECGIPYAIGLAALWAWWCIKAAGRGDWAVSLPLVGLGLVAVMDFPLQIPVQASVFWMMGGLCDFNRKGELCT